MENSKDGVVEQTEFQVEFVHGHFHGGVDAGGEGDFSFEQLQQLIA